MKISELIAELASIMQSQGDVDCYVFDMDYDSYYKPSINFGDIRVTHWNEDSNHLEYKTVKAVSIDS